MKLMPLNDQHLALGAKMVDFAGYSMPVQYSSIIEEHHAVRQSVGMFDTSHMGEFIIRGKEALHLVQKVTSNDASKLQIYQAQYSCMPNHNGGIVDDLIVYRLPEDMCAEGEQAFMLVVNASNLTKDFQWITENNTFDTNIIDISEQTCLLAIQGPNAKETIQKLTKVVLDDIEYYHFRKGEVAGIGNVLISATGYTGSGGFELYVRNDDVVSLWNAVLEAGAEYDIKPCGLGCRDTLRLEMGYCLYGNDINDVTNPLEAGLGWITKLKKEADFVAKDIITKHKEDGLKRKLVGFKMLDKRVPRHDYPIVDSNGQTIGIVTSGTQSPTLDEPIGMGYVDIDHSALGSRIYISLRNKNIEADVVSLPFIDPGAALKE